MTGQALERDQTLGILSDATGHPVARLQPGTHLEAELGVDSLMLEGILLRLEGLAGVTDQLPRDVRTVGDLTKAVYLLGTDRPGTDTVVATTSARGDVTGPTAEAPGYATVLDDVCGTIARHTQHDPATITPDARLESDLGVDSLMETAILGELSAKWAPDARLAGGHHQVRDIADAVYEASDGVTPMTPQPAAAQAAGPPTSAPAPAPAAATTEHTAPPRPVAQSADWDGLTMKDFRESDSSDLLAKVRAFRDHRLAREREHLYWYGMPSTARSSNRAVLLDEQTGRRREFLQFASNNYLGLSNHDHVTSAIADAAGVYGATNTGCRIIGGTTELHKELERRLAAFKGREACIIFPGGYSANLGTISALVGARDTVLLDRYNHMSIVDGAVLSGARRRAFAHNDTDQLEQMLRSVTSGGALVAVDGVFSMHGDIAPLPEIRRICREHGALLLVDDAHATGVLGRTGAGTAEHHGLKGDIDIEVGTMSKALAGVGGFTVADGDVVEYLRYYANSYVFAATIPAPTVAGLIASLEVLEREPELLDRLWQRIRQLRSGLTALGLDTENTESAIVPVVVGDEYQTLQLGREVRARGLFCQTVVYPGIATGQGRLRLSVSSEHTAYDIDRAVEIIREGAQAVGLLPDRRDAGQ